MKTMLKVLLLVALVAVGSAEAKAKKKATPTPEPTPAPTMCPMATPAPELEKLAPFRGMWSVEAVWSMPGMPEEKATNVVKEFPVHGGLRVQSQIMSTSGSMPFEGLAYTTWDPAAAKYKMVWMDNMGPDVFTYWGAWSDDKTLVYEGKNEMMGKSFEHRMTTTITGENTLEWKMEQKGENGEYATVGTQKYTRIGGLAGVSCCGPKAGCAPGCEKPCCKKGAAAACSPKAGCAPGCEKPCCKKGAALAEEEASAKDKGKK